MGRNGQKRARKYFCQNFHWIFIVKDQKCSFIMQNKQNPINRFGKIGQMGVFGPKWAKKRRFIFCQNFHWLIIVKDDEWVSICETSKILWSDLEKLVKMTVLGQNGKFRTFFKNPKMSLPYTDKAATLWKKLEKSSERILRVE